MILDGIRDAAENGRKLLAVLIDPDKFDPTSAECFFQRIPQITSHIFVGGSRVIPGKTEEVLKAIKIASDLPILLFPGDYTQISGEADAVLFLSLLSGRNPEYLIEQQLKAVPRLKQSNLEIIPSAYLLIDGGRESAVQRVSQTTPIPQFDIELIQHTALAGQYMGKKLVYLEAGSGALFPVSPKLISEVKAILNIPLLVGGGIRSEKQLEQAYEAGADMVVIGTAFEEKNYL